MYTIYMYLNEAERVNQDILNMISNRKNPSVSMVSVVYTKIIERSQGSD